MVGICRYFPYLCDLSQDNLVFSRRDALMHWYCAFCFRMLMENSGLHFRKAIIRNIMPPYVYDHPYERVPSGERSEQQQEQPSLPPRDIGVGWSPHHKLASYDFFWSISFFTSGVPAPSQEGQDQRQLQEAPSFHFQETDPFYLKTLIEVRACRLKGQAKRSLIRIIHKRLLDWP